MDGSMQETLPPSEELRRQRSQDDCEIRDLPRSNPAVPKANEETTLRSIDAFTIDHALWNFPIEETFVGAQYEEPLYRAASYFQSVPQSVTGGLHQASFPIHSNLGMFATGRSMGSSELIAHPHAFTSSNSIFGAPGTVPSTDNAAMAFDAPSLNNPSGFTGGFKNYQSMIAAGLFDPVAEFAAFDLPHDAAYARGYGVTQTVAAREYMTPTTPVSLPWLLESDINSQSQAQSRSETLWETIDRSRPTADSRDISSHDIVPRHRPSRHSFQRYHSSRTSLSLSSGSAEPLQRLGLVHSDAPSTVQQLTVPTSSCASLQPSAEETNTSIVPQSVQLTTGTVVCPHSLTLFPDLDNTTQAKSKRKRIMTEPGKDKARAVRKVGACLRCRMYKLGCDGEYPCGQCKKVENSHRIYNQPCYREDLNNVQLVRLGSGKSGEARMAFKNYQYTSLQSAPKELEMNWQLPFDAHIELPTWFAPIRGFRERYEDLLHEEWYINGEPHMLKLPAFAASDTAILTNRLETFIEKCRPTMQELMLEQTTDELSAETYREAVRYADAKESELIRLAIRVHTTAMLSAGWGSIVGEETLNIPLVDGAKSAYCGDRPIPVPLAHQFDVVFVNAMERTERQVVKLLRSKIFQKDPKPWYEIFLAYFILITHLQFIHGQAKGFMEIREKTASGGQVSFIIKNQVAKWNYSAGNMLHHYRCVLRGFLPFIEARKNPEQLRQNGDLDDDALAYIRRANQLLAEQDKPTAGSAEHSCPTLDLEQSWIQQLFREQYM